LRALSFMGSALEMLDKAGAPADIGAHLDMAMCTLLGRMRRVPKGAHSADTADQVCFII
jgi:hypothetical protein